MKVKNGDMLLEQESHACPIIENLESMAHIPNQDAGTPHCPMSGTDTSDADTSEEIIDNHREMSFPFRSKVLR